MYWLRLAGYAICLYVMIGAYFALRREVGPDLQAYVDFYVLLIVVSMGAGQLISPLGQKRRGDSTKER